MKKGERFGNDLTSLFIPMGGGLTAPPIYGKKDDLSFQTKNRQKINDEKIKEKRSQ